MNNTPLKELDWFSFNSDLNKLKHLSIFQAIAYILRNEENLIPLGDDYERLIHKLEIDSADDIFGEYGETTDQYAAKKTVTLTSQEEYCIPESEIKEDLTILNENRFRATVSLGAPISTIYTLLQSEIDKHTSNQKVTLEIEPIPIGGIDNYYFKRSKLKKWKSLPIIKEFGLLDAKLKRSDVSSDNDLEKFKIYIGMLIQVLAYQSKFVEEREVKCIKGNDINRPNWHRIYDIFNYHFLSTKQVGGRDFPSENTFRDDVIPAYEFFLDAVEPQLTPPK